MFGMSAGEIILIAIIALVLFGNEKLPENLKKFFEMTRGVKNFFLKTQHSIQEIKYDLEKEIQLHEFRIAKDKVHIDEVLYSPEEAGLLDEEKVDKTNYSEPVPLSLEK